MSEITQRRKLRLLQDGIAHLLARKHAAARLFAYDRMRINILIRTLSKRAHSIRASLAATAAAAAAARNARLTQIASDAEMDALIDSLASSAAAAAQNQRSISDARTDELLRELLEDESELIPVELTAEIVRQGKDRVTEQVDTIRANVAVSRWVMRRLEALIGRTFDYPTEDAEFIEKILLLDGTADNKYLLEIASSLMSVRLTDMEVRALPAATVGHIGPGGMLVPSLADVQLTADGERQDMPQEIYNLFYTPITGDFDACLDDIVEDKERLAFDTAYLNLSYRPQACLVTAVIEYYKDVIERRRTGKYKKQAIDYTHVWEVCKGSPLPADGPLPLSLRELVPFLQRYRLPLTAIGIDYRVLFRFCPAQPNTHIEHKHMYILVHNRHCWILNTGIPSLSHKLAGRDRLDDSDIAAPSAHYRLTAARDSVVAYASDSDALMKAKFGKASSATVVTPSSVESLFIHLVDTCQFIVRK